MSKNLEPGTTLPDFELPDENGDLHRLSDLQGDNCLVLMLGRGEHCPRERQHQREMVKFHEWCPVAFTELVTVLPNDLHDIVQDAIATGAHWTFLADADLEVQRHARHQRVHRPAPRPRRRAAHADPLARPEDREGLRRLLVLGPPVGRTSSGPTCRRSISASRPDYDPTTPAARAAWERERAVASA